MRGEECPRCGERDVNPSTRHYWTTEYDGERVALCPTCFCKVRGLYGRNLREGTR